MAEETTDDPGGTVAATTEGEDMAAESTAIAAMEAGGTVTGTRTTPEPGRTAQATENPEAGGTPAERLETGRTEGGTTAAMAGAPTTAIRMPEVSGTAAWSPEDGRIEPWNTKGDHLSVTTRYSTPQRRDSSDVQKSSFPRSSTCVLFHRHTHTYVRPLSLSILQSRLLRKPFDTSVFASFRIPSTGRMVHREL